MRKPNAAAKRRIKRKSDAIEKLVKANPFKPDPAAVSTAVKCLASHDNRLSASSKLEPALVHVIHHQTGRKLSRTSRKKYLNCLDMAFAIVRGIQAIEADAQAPIIRTLCGQLKIDPTKIRDIHSLALRAVIDYGADESGNTSPTVRGIVSRDVNALRYLKVKNVGIGGVVDYQKRYGGGPDAWARAWTKLRTEANSAGPDSDQEVPEGTDLPEGTEPLKDAIKSVRSKLKDGRSVVLLVTKFGDMFVAASADVAVTLKQPPSASLIWSKIKKLATKRKNKKAKKSVAKKEGSKTAKPK